MPPEAQAQEIKHEPREEGCLCTPMPGTRTALFINLKCPVHGDCPWCQQPLTDHPLNGCW